MTTGLHSRFLSSVGQLCSQIFYFLGFKQIQLRNNCIPACIIAHGSCSNNLPCKVELQRILEKTGLSVLCALLLLVKRINWEGIFFFLASMHLASTRSLSKFSLFCIFICMLLSVFARYTVTTVLNYLMYIC